MIWSSQQLDRERERERLGICKKWFIDPRRATHSVLIKRIQFQRVIATHFPCQLIIIGCFKGFSMSENYSNQQTGFTQNLTWNFPFRREGDKKRLGTGFGLTNSFNFTAIIRRSFCRANQYILILIPQLVPSPFSWLQIDSRHPPSNKFNIEDQ